MKVLWYCLWYDNLFISLGILYIIVFAKPAEYRPPIHAHHKITFAAQNVQLLLFSPRVVLAVRSGYGQPMFLQP